jgi:hypothetical protein
MRGPYSVAGRGQKGKVVGRLTDAGGWCVLACRGRLGWMVVRRVHLQEPGEEDRKRLRRGRRV